MAKDIRFVGLDEHADTISVAVAEDGRDGEVTSVGKIPNRPEAIRKLMKRLGDPKRLRVAYEAGPCGYVLYWLLTAMGIECVVAAPTLIPQKSGDRVKTDRKDAVKLARAHRAGELTAVWVPSPEHEALRDIVRARECALEDQHRARQRLQKFLLRHGWRRPKGMTAWTGKHRNWLGTVTFENKVLQITFTEYLSEVDHATDRLDRIEHYVEAAIEKAPAELREVIDALQTMRGIAKITAITAAVEVGNFSRFSRAGEIMSFSGLVSREHSSANVTCRGSITKTGNAHLRRVLVEAAWHYRHAPAVGRKLKRRHEGQSEEVKAIAWKAQHRLHKRFCAFVFRGKPATVAATAVARELLGFMWSIGAHVERQNQAGKLAVAV